MDHWSNVPQDDFLEFKQNPNSLYSQEYSHPPNPNTTLSLASQNSSSAVSSSSSYTEESLQQLKNGFAIMMSSMERLEQRLNRVEQSTSQILKNQQETLQVPFMSQAEIDRARQVAEQLEQDTSVAKQLQASYNKEIEIRKKTSSSVNVSQQGAYKLSQTTDCPICGVKVNTLDIQGHVDQCLEVFGNDPKKQTEVQETKKKVDQGFFGRMLKFNSTSTKTETKVTTTQQQSTSSTAPTEHPSYDSNTSGIISPPYGYPTYAYPPMNNHAPPTSHNGMPMMMPMYMYPSFPPSHMNAHSNE